MAARLFAMARTIAFSAFFVSLWTWSVPRWVTGAKAFAGRRQIGWIVIVPGTSAAV